MLESCMPGSRLGRLPPENSARDACLPASPGSPAGQAEVGGRDSVEAARPPVQPSRQRVPPHLRRHVVEQNYAEYNAADAAVWRFVLTQIYDTLRHTAHPAYERGLGQTGISLERIPSIDEMDRCLQRFGWGAVCVDGFVPPRAFVEFQALGILPIAADIRTRRHLVYTPAPDIIHEAAGHAPILPDPAYAAFLKRIGRIGAMAFSSPEDDRVYRAIFRLSELKERPDASAHQIARAERDFAEAVEAVTRTTEATRMSRLYWWTAEYGLVGTPDDYKLYGAGLLSSLGESHSCHRKEVRKLPLSVDCMDVAYDITREQPQLFVARDFEHLEEVLDEAAQTLAAQRGGLEALREAELSGEVASLTVGGEDGVPPVDVIGVVQGHAWDGSLLRVELGGRRLALVRDGALLSVLPLPAADGAVSISAELLAGFSDPEWRRLAAPSGDRVRLPLAGGNLVGTVRHAVRDEAGRNLVLVLEEAQLGDEALRAPVLFTTGRILRARAGATDPAYYSASIFPGRLVPEPRHFDADERPLLALYEEAAALARASWGARAAETVGRIHDRLRLDYPEEWLLRWNLLEVVLRRAPEDPRATDLWDELERLEVRFAHAEPIALGLRHLARLADPR